MTVGSLMDAMRSFPFWFIMRFGRNEDAGDMNACLNLAQNLLWTK
jgi:hypothetical protein